MNYCALSVIGDVQPCDGLRRQAMEWNVTLIPVDVFDLPLPLALRPAKQATTLSLCQ